MVNRGNRRISTRNQRQLLKPSDTRRTHTSSDTTCLTYNTAALDGGWGLAHG